MKKKIKVNELYRGVRLKTEKHSTEVADSFMEIEILESLDMENVKVRSLKTGDTGIWWNRFIVNHGYYKIE